MQDKRLADALLQVKGAEVDKIVITHPLQANDYFAGAIDIYVRGVPLQKLTPMDYSLKRL